MYDEFGNAYGDIPGVEGAAREQPGARRCRAALLHGIVCCLAHAGYHTQSALSGMKRLISGPTGRLLCQGVRANMAWLACPPSLPSARGPLNQHKCLSGIRCAAGGAGGRYGYAMRRLSNGMRAGMARLSGGPRGGASGLPGSVSTALQSMI